MKLQESGQLHVLKRKWWKQKRGGGQCAVSLKSSIKICNCTIILDPPQGGSELKIYEFSFGTLFKNSS